MAAIIGDLRKYGTALAAAAVLSLAAVGCGDDADDDGGSGGGGGGSAADVTGIPEDLSGTLTYYDTAGSLTTKSMQPLMDNFTEATGVRVVDDYSETDAKFLAAAEEGQGPWNLVLFAAYGDFLKAKQEGWLKKIDTSIVPYDKLEDSAVDPYGIRTERYGSVLTWNTESYPADGEQPSSMADLFDTEKFPGKRCFFQYPQFGATIEAPLLADGVAADAIYPLDVDRALDKLDTVKDDIVWWSEGTEQIQNLANGSCDMGIAWSGRVYDAIETQGLPLDMTWNDAVISSAVWSIPKSAPDPKLGESFLSWFVQDLEGQREFVEGAAYATEIKALPLEDYPEAPQRYIALGDNVENAVEEDGEYYAKNIDTLVERFNEWVVE